MGKAAELKKLSSVVRGEDGQECSLEALSLKELEVCQKQMKENLEIQMSCYFMQHPDEWERFLEG